MFEDYPDCIQAKMIVKNCNELETTLYKSCGSAKPIAKVNRWLFDDTVGNMGYLREELFQRCKCEQI